MTRFDLTRMRPVKSALISRWPQLVLQIGTLAIFVVAMIAGLTGTPVGNRNSAIVVVWIAWWTLLVLIGVPLLGRGWCSVCPIPLPGEWLQRGAVLGPIGSGHRAGLGLRWPRRLRSMWLQNAGFVLLAVLSTTILTRPVVSAVVLALFFVGATGVALLFERRAFCRYLCPVGGFIGLYSQLAPLELRVRDRTVCACHATKTCYVGDEQGYGCPWNVFPAGLRRNTYCGLCLECLRTCPLDNVAIRARPPGAVIAEPRGRRLDEAFKALILLGSAVVYSAVLLGPWGALKTTAYAVGTPAWWRYATGFSAFLLVVLPAAFAAAIWIGEKPHDRSALRQRFSAAAAALIPLGAAAWLAFTLSFAFSNLSYVWPVLSDPLGVGWDLMGTAGWGWTPYRSDIVPAVVTVVLAGGLAWTSAVAGGISARQGGSPAKQRRRSLPVVMFSLAVTLGLLWLLVG